MEQQNNKVKTEAGAAPGASSSGKSRNRRRGHRSHGGKQDIRTRADNFINDAPAAQSGASGERPKQQQGQAQNQNKGQGQNRQRGAQDHGKGERSGNRQRHHHGRRERADGVAETKSDTLSAPLRRDVAATPHSPSLFREAEDKWLDDTFAPLHEVEVHDADAEEHARQLLDAEGPLLFREEKAPEQPAQAELAENESVEIVGVRFKNPGKVYYFAPGKVQFKRGMYAIVETARGEEYGEVCLGNERIPLADIVQPLRRAVRIATEEDARHHEENQQKENEAFRVCRQKIDEHGLDMKLVEAQYTFDNSKLLFYFTSDGRVDFRELVKDLAGVFRTRIELRQIGIRDEAKLLGGLGTCGRPLCCAGFLSDFVQVSIKMAKEQNLSLNSSKISGCCGRLMCCLRYEFDTYETEIRLTPSVGSTVETKDGRGQVIANHPLKGTVTVKLADEAEAEPRVYHRDEVRRLPREASGGATKPQETVQDGE